ncbi:GNAT family N-acetyltransferase [Agaribacterium sp. ZY112]|uniref:GNAT family N-acetyltransferase n=1 Tax=Agaribacterium sp. ZY112 TaxID=3233574 RepID=UPI0035254A3D
MANIDIQPCTWAEQQDELKAIRCEVFVREQHVPIDEEFDEYEVKCQHWIAFVHEQAAGCIRLIKEKDAWRISRLAVLAIHRQQGLGSALLNAATRYALSNKHRIQERIYMHAQTSAIVLYQKLDWQTEGPRFDEVGIEHQRMCFITSAENCERVFQAHVERLAYPNHYLQHFHTMAELSSKELLIYSQHLNEELFNQEPLIEALSLLARKNKHVHIRILVEDSQNLDLHANHLVYLLRRLSSKISLHQLTDKHHLSLDYFMLFDKKRLLYFNNEKHFSGFACYQAATEALPLIEAFEHAWEHLSHADMNLRQLRI